MGIYTELIFGCSLKKDTPIEVINKLRSMCGHEGFEYFGDDGRNVFWCYSYSFGVSQSKPYMAYDDGVWVISTRGNIKNYLGEIEDFLKWIKPYIESGSGSRDMYAIVMYEEDETPTIYYLHD